MKRRTVAMFLIFGAVAFCYSAVEAIRVRDEARKLTAELYDNRRQNARLRDESRSLELEYYTFADYGDIRARAEALGMREPSLEDGTMVYLAAEAGR